MKQYSNTMSIINTNKLKYFHLLRLQGYVLRAGERRWRWGGEAGSTRGKGQGEQRADALESACYRAPVHARTSSPEHKGTITHVGHVWTGVVHFHRSFVAHQPISPESKESIFFFVYILWWEIVLIPHQHHPLIVLVVVMAPIHQMTFF